MEDLITDVTIEAVQTKAPAVAAQRDSASALIYSNSSFPMYNFNLNSSSEDGWAISRRMARMVCMFMLFKQSITSLGLGPNTPATVSQLMFKPQCKQLGVPNVCNE